MKKYRNLVESLPSKTVVFAYGRFNPPTIGHQLLVQLVKKIAVQNKSEYFIYTSSVQDKKNPLTAQQKQHYLDLMFPNTNFISAPLDQKSYVEVVDFLSEKYKNIIYVGDTDKKVCKFIPIKNPDVESDQLRVYASKGDYESFRKGLPISLRDIDAKRLMNDVRSGMNLKPIKEKIVLGTSTIREKYFNKDIYNIGDIVESITGQEFTIIKRGTNNVLCKDSDGTIHNKWIHEIHIKEM